MFDWLTVATAGDVIWKHAFVLVHPASEGTPTDLDAAVLGAVTSELAVTVPATAGHVTETSLTLGITGAHPGDELFVMLGRDADDGSDTCASDIRLREPVALTYVSLT